jgi:23S rRNA (cytosine1962-C5)-methyltransferase
MNTLELKPGKEKSLERRHPWVFSGAIAQVSGGEPQDGETVRIQSADGRFLAWAAYSQKSQIRARVWSWREQTEIGPEFLRARLAEALDLRRMLFPEQPDGGIRLVHAESDGLPGLIVDRYADMLVMQCLSSGPERWREALADLLVELTGLQRIYERSDAEVRKLEGLEERVGPLSGDFTAEAGAAPLAWIEENGIKFGVDYRGGHKTGFYLDQRLNRAMIRDVSRGRRVLDCFAYTGGFSLSALAGGADHVTLVDSSAPALETAWENIQANQLPKERVTRVEGDVFTVLRAYRDRGLKFDLIVLDPPKFAPTAALAERAARGYKDINLLAFKLLAPGGLLATFSCSGGVDEALFQKIVAGAALDAGRDAKILRRLGQSPDHPIGLAYPEGAYLKGFLIA